MKEEKRAAKTVEKDLSRRKFLGQSAAAAMAFSIVPRYVLGGPGFVPPSDKVNIAFIGVGSQGLRVMLHFLKEADVQGVAVCDVNKSSADHPQWDDHEFCKSVRKLIGVDTGWDWLSPDQPVQLTHSMKVTSGVAGREPCQQIVNGYYGSKQASGKYNGCAAYNDYRELLEKQKDVDAVVVCTTDNLHAAVSAAAMKKGKHVFCQKPLTHTIYEARRMAEIARTTGVATQIAVGNQASEATRQLCEWIWSGAIGPVREVHNWSSRPYWPQGIERPKEVQPVPAGLDWDLWLGPAPERPFHHAYLPFVWRGWDDFGCGALGDMGSYSYDTIFRVLKLEAPVSVEASSSERRISGPGDEPLAVGDRPVDVGAAAELDAEQHVDGIGKLRREVHHGGVKGDQGGPQRPDRGQHRAEDRRVHHRGRHRPGLVDGQHHVPGHDLLPPPVADQALRDDRAVGGLVAGEVRGDRPVPVDVARPGAAVRAARLSAPETALRVRFATRRSISATTRATT